MKELAILLLIVIILALTNPTADTHKQAVFDSARAAASQAGGLQGALGGLGVNLLQGLNAVPFQYDNYIIFSTLSMQGRIVTIGALGTAIVINQ